MRAVVELTAEVLRRSPLPSPEPDGDKNSHGRLLAFGGDAELAGAGLLAALAALRAGAGKIQIVARAEQAMTLAFALPEARVIAAAGADGGGLAPPAVEAARPSLETADAVLAGPGWADEEAALAMTRAILQAAPRPVLLDAGALTALKHLPRVSGLTRGRAVLTPHHGEMAALTGAPRERIAADPLSIARDTARRLDATVVLKSAETVIAAPDGRVWRHGGGVAGLGVCGSGDVLAGIIAGLLARGAAPELAAIWGVWVHAQAGRRLTAEVGPLGFLARELLREIPRALAETIAA